MAISLLKISNLRNITQLNLEPLPGINMFWGDNGSGKTTLLEAIYLSARGKSFRGRRAGSLITTGEESLTVFAHISQNPIEHNIGIQKKANNTEVRHNGNKVHKLSDLARITPLQIITPSSHEIIERGPEYRRRFLEWGVFHVEHSYQSIHRNFIKTLLNRNASLRTSHEQLSTWDSLYVEAAEILDSIRHEYFLKFRDLMLKESHFFLPGADVEIGWNRGWKDNCDLNDLLSTNLEKDRDRGYTQSGPHRADLNIKFNGKSAKETASRGQQKLMVVCMHLAQAQLTLQQNSTPPILLIDELASELDRKNRSLLLERLKKLQSQVFLTGTDPIEEQSIELFHVEHGTIV